MPKDLRSAINPAIAIPLVTVTGTATGAGSVIDTLGYESVTFVIHPHAAHSTSTVAFSLQAGNASGSLSAVATSNLIGATSGLTISSGATGTLKSVGYNGGLRYVRLDYSATGTATGSQFSAVCIEGHPDKIPTVSATA